MCSIGRHPTDPRNLVRMSTADHIRAHAYFAGVYSQTSVGGDGALQDEEGPNEENEEKGQTSVGGGGVLQDEEGPNEENEEKGPDEEAFHGSDTKEDVSDDDEDDDDVTDKGKEEEDDADSANSNVK